MLIAPIPMQRYAAPADVAKPVFFMADGGVNSQWHLYGPTAIKKPSAVLLQNNAGTRNDTNLIDNLLFIILIIRGA